MAREEAKVAWRAVPAEVRLAAEHALGASVARATRVWGGYAPSVTLRLALADGRRAFLKASSPEASELLRSTLATEERVYRALGEGLLRSWAPAFLGAFTRVGWHGVLLEDLGPASVPPWTRVKARRMAEEYGRFHASTLGLALPEWVPSAAEAGFASGWESVATDADCLAALASLAGDSADEASAWLSLALPVLSQAASEMVNIGPPFALLHVDTRSDNLRLTSDGLRLFDWPYAAAGPPELDLAAFAQSVPGEGGPSAQQMSDWYAGALPVREEALTACVSSVAAFFAQRAWQPPIEGLPRLRGVQRRQLKVSLRWAADRLALPEPHWLAAVPS